MRSLPFVLLALALTVACAPAPPVQTVTPEAITAALTASGLPVRDVRVYTAETDPNKLLGRPDQYVGKVSWVDTRGGDAATIEIFPTTASLEQRKTLTEAISKTGGAFAQYIYARPERRLLLRLPHALTPEQAKAYEDLLGRL